jgi:hypothetical protein
MDIVSKVSDMAVSLKDVIENMDMQNKDAKAFFNPKTEKFRIVSSDYFFILDGTEVHLTVDLEEFSDPEIEWVKETLEIRDSEDYLPLPGRAEIDEYGIIEDFCTSFAPPEVREELMSRIHGSGVFRKFKETIARRGIEEQWYAYRQEALEAVAINWLAANAIEFTADEEAS